MEELHHFRLLLFDSEAPFRHLRACSPRVLIGNTVTVLGFAKG